MMLVAVSWDSKKDFPRQEQQYKNKEQDMRCQVCRHIRGTVTMVTGNYLARP